MKELTELTDRQADEMTSKWIFYSA